MPARCDRTGDKRQLIDSLYGQMIEIARAGIRAMAEVDQVLNKSTGGGGIRLGLDSEGTVSS